MDAKVKNWIFRWSEGGSETAPSLQLESPGTKGRWEFGSGNSVPLAATGKPLKFTESRGFFSWKPGKRPWTSGFHIETADSTEESVSLHGKLSGDGSRGSFDFKWEFIPLSDYECRYRITVEKAEACRISFSAEEDERIFGTGTQFTHVNLKGKKVPILSQEPGIGRGVQPLSWLLNASYGAAGTDVNSNAPSAHFISSEHMAWMSENTEPCFLDFSQGNKTSIDTDSGCGEGILFCGNSPRELTELFTGHCGRMRPLPSWVHDGAIIGVQGGSEALNLVADRLRDSNAAVTGYWLQDWVGQRTTAVGKQLWWNWERDHAHYPDWDERAVGSKEGKHPHLLTYFNPFLVDPREKGEWIRNLADEARQQGFLVLDERGEPCAITNTSFDALLLDLSSPETISWFKDIIKDHIQKDTSKGWMADFGEALPMDATLPTGVSPHTFHNQYPVEWARLNKEAIAELDLEDDIFFFTRSGHTKSPGQSRCFWLGDQLTSWHREDGIHSALAGLLSSGFSGFSLNHSDVGGYTTTAVPGLPKWLPGVVFKRSSELLMRWTELNSFTPVFRTHEGNRPEVNHQIWDSEDTLSHFSHFSRIYAALGPYRRHLETAAYEKGYPLVRHPWFVCPDEKASLDSHSQFFLGDDLLVAPILEQGKTSRQLWMPEGSWTHLWTGETLTVGQHDGAQHQPAKMGQPIAWYRSDSAWVQVFKACTAIGPWREA